MKSMMQTDHKAIKPLETDGRTLSDEERLEDVMEQYQTQLLRYATRVLNNAEAAQDVVQDAFVRLYRNWKKVLDRGVPLKGWLFRTTHNAAVDYIRKESRLKDLHERQAEFNEIVAPKEGRERREMDERQALVLEHLNALNTKEREVLVLRLQEGMSYKEIAKVIRRSEGYVGTLIHSATKKLGTRLRSTGVVS